MIDDNILAGLSALERIVAGEEIIENAMSRCDLSQYDASTDITFYWGYTGDSDKNFKRGYGISHIGAKHGVDSVLRALTVISQGVIDRYVKGNKTVVLSDGEYEAVLALTRNGVRETWLFNGWKKKEKADEASEVSTQSGSTQINPTFSREDLGAAISLYKSSNKIDIINF